MKIIQDNRQISVKSPLGKDVLLFRKMAGSDQLSRLSEYHVELLSEKKNILFDDILGKPMCVELKFQGGGIREFNGIVTKFSSRGHYGGFHNYVALIQPWLWLLTRSSDCRIFQEKTIIEIITEIFHKPVYGGMAHFDTGKLRQQYPKLDYCVQYQETDFNFVNRLLEHAGIYYFFLHEKGRDIMVLADSFDAHKPVAGYESIEFAKSGDRQRYGDELINSWIRTGEIQSSGFEVNDFDFKRMLGGTYGAIKAKDSIPAAYNQPAYQLYEYPGGYATTEFGRDIAVARIESYHGQCEQILAESNARGLTVGALFNLTEHPTDDFNRKYLVTHADYFLNSDDYKAGGGQNSTPIFECTFNATGIKYPFRPARRTPKPYMQGPQTAVVVGKEGEEMWTDKYGRVKVQFHWDRLGQRNEKSSCWVRVAQSWAGQRWGTMFIPRIGMEVVVEFLDGDADRPLITGCVYNSATMPPYELPANQTRSTMKTNSSKGGAGFNEIRFEDKQGAEEIFIQAQKDANRVVKHNDTLKVGFLHKEPGSQTIDIKLNQTLNIGNDQNTDIDGKQDINIAKTLVVEAGTSIELKVGASSILLEPGKVTIKSPQIVVEGSSTVEVKAAALTSIKGTPVKIN